jgi:glycosyltransferase involved in cell wall biosynthesis
MSVKPKVSVVMGAYNGAAALGMTIESILSQANIDLEFVIVNDGSTDDSGKILDEYARRDTRVRVIHQQNAGLTRALIRGCAAAAGEFIARQDVGDVSLSGRLARQAEILAHNPGIVLTACGTRLLGPEQELLYEISQVGLELNEGLRQLSLQRIRGPSHHGSTMFRRDAYESAGGYRAAFRVAQDLDLWLRLAEIGKCLAISNILYEAAITKGSISHLHRSEQIETTKVVLECASARRSGQGDAQIIASWLRRNTRPLVRNWVPQRLQDARYYYFIGSNLRARQPERAQAYYWRALNAWFAYPAAWYGLLRLR